MKTSHQSLQRVSYSYIVGIFWTGEFADIMVIGAERLRDLSRISKYR